MSRFYCCLLEYYTTTAMIAHGDCWNTFRVTLDPSTGFKGVGEETVCP